MTNQVNGTSKRSLGVLALALLNLAIIFTLRGLPIMAEEGTSLIFYFIVIAAIFLIPVSLVCAELATGWPPKGPGGVYIWVTEAFGPRLGFLAIWLQWIENVVWFPSILAFVGATFAYIYDPELANNKYYMIALILTVYWGATILNFRGIKSSGRLSIVCVTIGTVLPGIVIIAFGILWLISGEPLAITFSFNKFFPNMSNIHNIVFLAGAVLIVSGIEVSAVHAQEVRNPKHTFPRATFLASAVAIVLLMLGSLSVAVVVPQKELSLVAGVMETFTIFFKSHGLKWLIPVFALLITAGAIGEITAWIIGPAKGLMITARHGNLPPLLQKINNKNVPTNIILVQASIVTVLTLVFLLMPTVSSSYWILTALSVLLYLIMYILVFAAGIRLRYSQPNHKRAYKIPGGICGMWFVAGLGILGSLFTFVIGFLPPSQIDTGSIIFYEGFLILGILVISSIPFIIMRFRKPGWRQKD